MIEDGIEVQAAEDYEPIVVEAKGIPRDVAIPVFVLMKENYLERLKEWQNDPERDPLDYPVLPGYDGYMPL